MHPALRIALALVASATAAHAQLRFVDIASSAGTAQTSYGRGTGMADLDADGRLDIVTGDAGAAGSFYRQQPDGSFVDWSAAWGIAPTTDEHWANLIADFDNDGDPDVYRVNGGFRPPGGPNQMLRNDLGTLGVFTDVTASSPAMLRFEQDFGGCALDYDRDGLLDVFHAVSVFSTPNVLLRNTGGLAFVDVSLAAGITHPGDFRHAGAGDYDGDGWVDVGAGNKFGANVLYRNLGTVAFADVAAAAGVDSPFDNFGFCFADFDNDGRLDVFLPKYQDAELYTTTKIFLNNGDGTFRDVSPGSGLGAHTDMGHDVGDLDGDGYPDLYIGTGSMALAAPDTVYAIVPDGTGGILAKDVSNSSGIRASGPSRMHGIGMGDIDADGDLDVYCGNGGTSGSDTSEVDFLWQNQLEDNTWLVLELTGVRSNRTAVGANAAVLSTTGRRVHRLLSIGRGFGNSPEPALLFSLKNDPGAVRAEIRWPSGVRQTVLSPPLSTRTPVTETGAVLVGTPTIGGTATFDLCGPAGYQADFFLSPNALAVPFAAFGGMVELAAPILPVGRATLGADGLGQFAPGVPNDPTLTGVTFRVQAWLHPAGSTAGSVLTPAIAFTL